MGFGVGGGLGGRVGVRGRGRVAAMGWCQGLGLLVGAKGWGWLGLG